MSNIDLNDLPPDLQATLSKKETGSERRVRIGKDLAVFSFAMLVLASAFLWSAWIILQPTEPEETRRLAQSVVIAVVSGLLGYLVKT